MGNIKVCTLVKLVRFGSVSKLPPFLKRLSEIGYFAYPKVDFELYGVSYCLYAPFMFVLRFTQVGKLNGPVTANGS